MQNNQLSDEQLKKKLMEKAIFYLSKYSSHTIKLKRILLNYILKNKIYISNDKKYNFINDILTKCKDYGYIDDELYTLNRARKLLNYGKSKRYAFAKLLESGINKDIAVKTINDVFGNNKNCDFKSAINFIKRKKIGLFHPDNSENYFSANFNHWMSMMARAGYKYDMAKKVLKIKTINDLKMIGG